MRSSVISFQGFREPYPSQLPGFSIGTYVPACHWVVNDPDFLVNQLLLDSLFILFPELKQFPFHPFISTLALHRYGLRLMLHIAGGDPAYTPTPEAFSQFLLLSDLPAPLLMELRSLPISLRKPVFFLLLAHRYFSVTDEIGYVICARLFFVSWFIYHIFNLLFLDSGRFAFFRLRFLDQTIFVPFVFSLNGLAFDGFRRPEIKAISAECFPSLKYLFCQPPLVDSDQEPTLLVQVIMRGIERCLFCWPADNRPRFRTFLFRFLDSEEEFMREPFLLPVRCGFRVKTELADAFFDRASVNLERPTIPFDPISVPRLIHYSGAAVAEVERLFLEHYADLWAYHDHPRRDPSVFYPSVDSSELRFIFPSSFLVPFF